MKSFLLYTGLATFCALLAGCALHKERTETSVEIVDPLDPGYVTLGGKIDISEK